MSVTTENLLGNTKKYTGSCIQSIKSGKMQVQLIYKNAILDYNTV